MDTSNSGANHDVFPAQNHKFRMGSVETSNSDAKVAVLNAQNDS